MDNGSLTRPAGADPARRRLTGLIEGFYGRPYSMAARRQLVSDLADLGLDLYLYAPKADPFLRRRWSEDWPADERRQLGDLAARCAGAGIAFCPGLSPFLLYEDYGADGRRRLRQRVDSLNALGAPLLAILFDDMPGAVPDLAARQGEIVSDVAAWSSAGRILVCPTYYSDDPVLDRVFGDRPADYRERLGAALPETAEIFWTGGRVCAERITPADVEAAAAAFGRPVVLWDNWPVNDGAARSRHLYLGAPPARAGALASACAGHLSNGMNQPTLSLPALAGLAELHGRTASAAGWLRARLGAGLASALARDAPMLARVPREELGGRRTAALRRRYAAIGGAGGREMVAWLDGEWTFDPACLTD